MLAKFVKNSCFVVKFVFLLFFIHFGFLHGAISQDFTPILVTMNFDGVEREEYFHCYIDKQKKIWVSEDDSQLLKFPKSPNPPVSLNNKNYICLDWYEGIEYNVDEHALVLTLLTPLDWHGKPRLTEINLENKGLRPEMPGAFLNYDVTGRYQNFNKQSNAAAFTELGLFNHYGVGTSGFLLNGYSFFNQQNNIARLDSTWTIDEPEHMSSWRFGDSISSGLAWNGAVRFAGIQYATNFNTQPSLITFPQPAVRGEAVLPSTIDILVNGTQTYEEEVGRGPFYISQVPFITGAGNIQVQTTDMLGRQQMSSYSYYTSPTLLKAGLSDYSFEVGSIRRKFGFKSNDYGRALAVGTYSLGLTDKYTAGLHAELLKDEQTLALGNEYLIGTLGIVSLGGAVSRATGENAYMADCKSKDAKRGIGGLVNLGFRRQTTFLSYGIQSTLASHDYMQIGTFHDKGYPNFTIQSFIGLTTENIGSFAFTYTNLNNAFNRTKIAPYEFMLPNSEVVMLSYSKSLWQNVFLLYPVYLI
ncbi:MAG: fimbria/pilus outer membrane usher protein [Proteobacteria bacterium]|nr:fimbria/pilus outer membrane usher protein [Pseudomonadota bacterium]